jgi:hypothetical protein
MIAAAVLPEMPPPAPRPFRFRAVGAAALFLLLFGGIWMTVGGAISVVFTVVGGPFWDDLLLDRRGVTAKAAAGLIEPTSARINRRRVHRVHYTFTDAGGVERAGSGITTDPDRVARLWGPFDLPIDYDPRAPERSRLTGESASLFGLFVLFPFAFAAVGAIVFAQGLRRLRTVRAIYVHGQPARAEVTAVAPTAMWRNRRRVMRVDYAFDTVTGRATGRATSVDPPPVGGTLWVLHLPSDPKRNVAA